MQIENKSNAPKWFVDAIQGALYNSIDFAKDILNIEQQPSSRIYIIEEKFEEVNERFSIDKLRVNLYNLSEQLQIVSSINKDNGIKELNEMLDQIIHMIRILIEEVNIQGKDRHQFPPNELINEITILLSKLDGQFKDEIENREISSVNLNGEIIELWKEICYIFPLIEFPYVRLGFFNPVENSINICYKSISNSIGKNLLCEYGALVLAHEYFHALHFMYIHLSKGKKIWDSRSQPAHIRRRAVKESLAEYFCLEYADKFLPYEVVHHAYQTASSHPFPNWGYAGFEIFENINYSDGKNNPLFSAVFYSSVLNMEDGYRLLRESKNRSSI